jgi:hypothetical protein
METSVYVLYVPSRFASIANILSERASSYGLAEFVSFNGRLDEHLAVSVHLRNTIKLKVSPPIGASQVYAEFSGSANAPFDVP